MANFGVKVKRFTLELPSGDRCAGAAIWYKGVELYRVTSVPEMPVRFDPIRALSQVEDELTVWLVAAVLDRLRRDFGEEKANEVDKRLVEYESEEEDIGL